MGAQDAFARLAFMISHGREYCALWIMQFEIDDSGARSTLLWWSS